MKRFFLLLMVAVAANVVMAQKIEYDSFDAEGNRIVSISKVKAGETNKGFEMLLGLYVKILSGEEQAYFLNLEFISKDQISMQPKSKLLLKNFRNEVVKLESTNDGMDNSNYQSYYSSRRQHLTQSYRISGDDLAKLINGVQKIRIQIDCNKTSVYDIYYKHDKVGATLKHDQDLIKKALKSKKINPIRLEDGF